ncbi:MAG: preprotein translocase subunit SecA, partial [Bdellovibrionales bacterium]|nr:preprotein translocase subunit SecA [Bdellovibrionales bacterium]
DKSSFTRLGNNTMLDFVVKKVFGSRNDRILKSLKPFVQRVNDLEASYQKMSDDELRGQTNKFRERIEKGQSLDEIQAEAFAVVREAAVRTLGMRHFDVQLIGGAVLHSGKIAEMKTGEGKTLVATLPSYLNALSGKGVHVVTVNDYLARRDAEWMGQVFRFLGLTVGVVVPGMEEEERYRAYRCDITYGQNNEFGFDYLRDNMKFEATSMVQRGHNYAIVDEVDSILIDEARTPLIISGPAEDATEMYSVANRLMADLRDGDFEVDIKTKQPSLTEQGVAHIEKILGVENLYDPNQAEMVHHVQQALKAHLTMVRDVDYVVRDGQVIIVDEFTGRLMAGRRWSDGLHQAVEAKEGLKIARENQTLASITFQNYFRMFDKLSGMTGTADTEAVEFQNIYGLEVVVIPTNKPMVRKDHGDVVFRTRREKYNAVTEDIAEIHESGQPILVGTVSIEQSEELSRYLKKKGVAHNVLNAKQHEREAEIVAQAGRLGSVTISTNMAGRGTDIMLGGNPEFLAQAECGEREGAQFEQTLKSCEEVCKLEKEKVKEVGGLFIIGTERHESRRIDNQLRGRSGRQGDPGESRFYVSLEDDLMKRFGGEMLQGLMTRFGMQEGEALEGGMMSRAIENAQRRVEGYHFDIRKHLLEYDDVMNKQREVIYNERARVLSADRIRELVLDLTDDLLEERVLEVCDERTKAMEWDLDALVEHFKFLFSTNFSFPSEMELTAQNIFDVMREAAKAAYQKQVETIGDEEFSNVEQHIYLQSLDHFWKLHLLEMDHLKEGIGLRGYGQKNPLHEYQKEGFLLFQRMLKTMHEDVTRKLYAIQILSEEEVKALEEEEQRRREAQEKQMALVHESMGPDAEDPDSEESKDPDSQREKMKQARKARRKRKK